MERPILFSTPMVQTILEGRKTMTRRIIKPQPEKPPATNTFVPLNDFLSQLNSQIKKGLKEIHSKGNGSGFCFPSCPYGKVGDIIYVRETYKHQMGVYTYKASPNVFMKTQNMGPTTTISPWKPSIYMPKSAARIFLEITDISVERLNDISEVDSINEGIEVLFDESLGMNQYRDYLNEYPNYNNPINSFFSLWRSINGLESLRDNPWVWVVKFKQISK
jgi:hypothetical protein